MTIFTGLPAELQLLILELVLPDDLINVAITCKQLWRLAEGPIKHHKALQSQYGSLTPGNSPDDHTLWDMLSTIIQNPRVAYYVHTVDFLAERNVYWDSEIWMGDQVRPEHQHPPSDYVKLFTSAASDGPLKLGDQEDSTDSQLETAIGNGSDGPIIALLLSRLPNLKQLTYINWGDSSWLLNVLEQAAAAHATSNPPLAFRNLTSVRLEHWGTGMCIDYRFMRYLICMPSMRFLSGHMIGGEKGESENSANLARSRVTGLEFSYSALSRDAMSETLSGIEALEKFSYECGDAVIYCTDYDPHGMLADLLKYAGHSLEELSLVNCEQSEVEETSPHTFLVEFQKLKHLDLGWYILVPDPDAEAEAEDEDEKEKALSQGFYTAENTAGNQGVNLADFLPLSLESLTLTECPVTGLDLLVKMLEQKEVRLPKLSKIIIIMAGYEYMDMLKLAEAAETAGVDYGQYLRS